MSDAATAPELPVTFRPMGARIVAVVAGCCLVSITVVLRAALPTEVRGAFTVLQSLTLLGVLAGILVVLFGIARTRVRADADGIQIRNGYRRHTLDWAEAVSIALPRGAPWAVIDTADGGVVTAMALQSADGERARAAVVALRGLIDAHGVGDIDA